MAPRLRLVWLVLVVSTAAANLPRLESAALAAGLDLKGEATAKEASGLYRQGLYEDAAKLFAKLTVDYPDMPIFERSLGACFYYLHKPEPALSNLRNYLVHRQDIPADDKAVVDRWIDEMEKLRAQTRATAMPAASGPAIPELRSSTAGIRPAMESPPPEVSTATPDLIHRQAGARLRTAGLGVAAVGVAALVTGLVLNVKVNKMSGDLQEEFNPGVESDRKRYKTAGWVGYGTGAACLAGGAILYYLGWRRGGHHNLALAPTVSPALAGTVFVGKF
jgi:hypothetical protein